MMAFFLLYLCHKSNNGASTITIIKAIAKGCASDDDGDGIFESSLIVLMTKYFVNEYFEVVALNTVCGKTVLC